MTWRMAIIILGMYVLVRLVIGIVDPSTMAASHHVTMQLFYGRR